MADADIGLIGLAVMGENLVLNMASNGYQVAVYNRTTSKVDNFIAGRAADQPIVGTHSLEELCSKLKRPRRVMIMVKAGAAVDKVIEGLLPHLEQVTSSSMAATASSPIRFAARTIWRKRKFCSSVPASLAVKREH